MERFVHCKEYDSSRVIGGSVKYAELLENGLKNNGNQVISYYRSSIYAGRVHSKESGYLNTMQGICRLVLGVIKTWFQSEPKVWIVHHPVMGSISLLARRKKLIYICHGPWAGEALDISRQGISNKAINRARRLIQSILVQQSDVVFFLSEYMKARIKTDLKIEMHNFVKYRLIPPIAEISSKQPGSVDKNEYRTIQNQIYICRRLVRRTGVYDFLERLAISEYRKTFRIIITGDGPERESIEQLIFRHKLRNVKMDGFVDEKKHRINYLTSEYMLLPSLANEGFGLVIIEAILNDCIPIVSINAGGGAEWMKRTCENLVYDGSIEGMVESISYASNNKAEVLKRLREKVKNLTKEHAADVIETVSRVLI